MVEVVMALAVASFGLISMMGLLSIGLETVHDAINTTTEAEIAQQIANQIQLANYSSISTNTTAVSYYFTQDGIATNAVSAVYLATVGVPQALTVPGGTAPSAYTNTLTCVISIWSKSAPQITNSIPIQISNNGS